MGNVHVQQAVAVYISSVYAHSRFVLAIFADSQPGYQRDILERTVVIIQKQEIRPSVIGDGDVRPAVVVKVGQHYSHPFRFGQTHSRLVAHVSRGAIVVVMVELGSLAFVVTGIAVRAITRSAFSTPEIVLRGPLNVIGDHQVEPPVFVVVKPSRTG